MMRPSAVALITAHDDQANSRSTGWIVSERVSGRAHSQYRNGCVRIVGVVAQVPFPRDQGELLVTCLTTAWCRTSRPGLDERPKDLEGRPERSMHTSSGGDRVIRLFRVECGRADPARVLGIDVEVLDDERTLTSAHSKDLDNAPSYVPLLDISGPLQPL